MSEPTGLAAAFLRQVAAQPSAIALVWQDEQISYAALDRMVEHARRRLSDLDLDRGEPVGVLAGKSPAAIVLVLACLLTGRRFLLPSPALAPQTLADLFAEAGCRHVLTVGVTPSEPAGQPAPLAAFDDAAPAFMLTTSGSTGTPKIVPLPYGAITRFTAWAAAEFGIGPGTPVLNYAPLNFDLCLLDVWTTLAYGGRVVLVDPAQAMRAGYLLRLLQTHEVHVVQAVPMCFGLLAAAAGDARFPAVREVIATGDVLGEQTLDALPRLFPSARLSNVYGCTETNDSFRATMAPGEHPVPLGDPLPGVATLIVGSDGAPVTGAGTGELFVRTPFQAAGYLDPARDAGRFGPDPLGRDDTTWFRTGDLVSRDADGGLRLIGRRDFQVKVRGVAVNTAEIEQVLLAHPEVAEAAVAVRPDPLTGRELAAVVRRTEKSTLNSLHLREHCARRLPQAAVPASLRITDDPLPRTATGKVDRTAAGRPHLTHEGVPS